MKLKGRLIINGLGIICLVVLVAWVLNKPTSNVQNLPHVKNVIVMVADGYGPGALALYREWNQLKALPTDQISHIGLMYTNSGGDYVTDSGAAATAMGTSVATYNKGIGVDMKGRPVTNLSEAFKKMGKSVGLISTNTVTDATPAGFAAHSQSRHNQSLIPVHYLDQGYDVILGGGRKKWIPKANGGKRKDGKDLIQAAQAKGYAYVEDREALSRVSGTAKLLGLFHGSYMSYKVDRKPGCVAESSKEPSLKEMTVKALDILSKNPKGFFLMSEGARVDHAAHAIDVNAMMYEIQEFYAALSAVYEWAKNRKDTLVVVVSDHDTMNLSPTQLTRYDAFQSMKCSTDDFAQKIERDADGKYTRGSIIALLKQNGVEDPTEGEIQLIASSHGMYSYKSAVAVGHVTARRFGVSSNNAVVNWETGTSGHTSVMIPVFARGIGSQVFQGVYHNTSIAKKIGALTGAKTYVGKPYAVQSSLAAK